MTPTHKTEADQKIITGLNEAEQTSFVQTVLEPPAPSARLRQAVQTYRAQRNENPSDGDPAEAGKTPSR